MPVLLPTIQAKFSVLDKIVDDVQVIKWGYLNASQINGNITPQDIAVNNVAVG